jgi:small conductance mechanosensitive channel
MANKKQQKMSNYLVQLISAGALILVFAVILILGIVIPDSAFAQAYSLVGKTTYVGADFNNIFGRVLGTVGYFGIFIGSEILIRVIVELSIKKSNNKVKTIARLVSSTVRYAAALVWLFLSLTLWGVDTTTLLVSAGILALIIGLGAQSLISDIIAGINIVFEGEYHVGDVVLIDGFRGTIEEIGLTITKLVDAAGNQKSINNSKITTVVNLSIKTSLAIVDFSIDYGEDLRKVEKVFEENKAAIKERIPELKKEPEYLGVNNLGASSVDLRFTGTCSEANRFIVQRALLRELYLVFGENGIYVPFNQLVLSARDNEPKVQEVVDKVK